MHKSNLFALVSITVLASTLAGCGSSREVEVTGEITAGSSVQANGPILLTFYDVIDEEETDAPTYHNVHEKKLDALGAFAEKADFEGDRVLVRAINDANGDGACSIGEAWAEVESPIEEDDTVKAVTLTLAHAACPPDKE